MKDRVEVGMRKRSRQQSVRVRLRHVWNGVSLYRAQRACVNSLLCLSLRGTPSSYCCWHPEPLPHIIHSTNTPTTPSCVDIETQGGNSDLVFILRLDVFL